MKRNPEISFIMPAYNAAEYIGEAVESVLAQDYEGFELIIIDDGSSDSTCEIAERYAAADPRVRLLRMDAPSGSAYQPRKKGITEARGTMVAPVDADDFVDSGYLRALVEKKESTGASMVYPTMWRYGEGRPERVTPTDDSLYKGKRRGKDCVKLTLGKWRINCNGGLIDRKIYLEAFSRFDSTVAYSCADEFLTRELLLIAPDVAFSEARYLYRVNPESITRRKTGKLFDFMTNNRLLVEFTREYYSEDSEEYILAQCQNFHGLFDASRKLNRYAFSKEARDYARRQMRECRKTVDFKILKGKVSPRYYALVRYGLLPLPVLLKVLDPLFFKGGRS